MNPSQWTGQQQQGWQQRQGWQQSPQRFMPSYSYNSPSHLVPNSFAPRAYQYNGSWYLPSNNIQPQQYPKPKQQEQRQHQHRPLQTLSGANAKSTTIDGLINFTKAVAQTYKWNNPAAQSPLYNFLKEQNRKNKRGWVRAMMEISVAKNDVEPLQYYDLLVDNSPQYTRHTEIMEVFGFAFDMTPKNTFNARAKKRKIQQTFRDTPTTFGTPRSARKIPSSAWKRRVTFSDVKGMKTPEHLTNFQSNLDSKLKNLAPEVTDSSRKKVVESAKNTANFTHLVLDAKRFDVLQLLRILSDDSIEVYRKDYIEDLREKSKIYCAVQSMLSKRKYTGSKECQQIVAAGVSMVPSISLEAAQYLIATVRHSLLLEIGYNASPAEIARTSPSAWKIKGALARLAASCLAKKLQIVEKAKYIYLACDKGHKDGVDHFVKILSCWDRQSNKVEFFMLDMDGAGSSDEDAADAVAFSLEQKEVATKLSGIATDSGGGGTLESFLEALERKGVVDNNGVKFVSPCSLHCLQLMFALPVEKAFGLGGLHTRNAMQLLHSMHDLEKYFPRDVWKQLVTDKIKELDLDLPVPKAMPKPVTTRWWWLHAAADTGLRYWSVWKGIAKDCIAAFGTTSYANIVSSSLEAMMKEEVYYINILFIRSYSGFMINPHFDFLQSKGRQSQVAGFNSESILVRVFLMFKDIESLQDGGWRQVDGFKPVVDHFSSPRWPTKAEQDIIDSRRETRQQLYGPKSYTKKENIAKKITKSMIREHRNRSEIDKVVQLHKESHKENYWVDLKENTSNTLTAIHSLFGFPKRRKKGADKTGTRLATSKEKKDELETLGDMTQTQFDFEVNQNRKKMREIDEKLSSIELGRKENLLHTFEFAMEDDGSLDTIQFQHPLKVLFGHEEGEFNIELTEALLETKLAELTREIDDLKQELHQRLDNELEGGPSFSHEDEMEQITISETDTDEEISSAIDANAVNEDFQTLVNRQINIFLTLAYRQYQKHFPRWANQLIFFGLASEQKTAAVVADFLLGNNLSRFDGAIHDSPIHKRLVDLGDFASFLTQTCSMESREDAISTEYFQFHLAGIKRLAEGYDLWGETILEEVQLLQRFVQDAILPVPSNTQFVELCIKEGMYVGKTNRTEASRSVLGIIRTFLIRETNYRARQNAANRSLQANQHTQQGKIGERIMNAKNKEEDKKTLVYPRGKYKAQEIFETVDSLIDNDSDQSEEKEAKIDRLMKKLSTADLHYVQRKKTRLIQRVREGKTRQKKQNKLQKRQEVGLTDTALGRIAYSSLARAHMAEVRLELEVRDADFDDEWGIKKLVTALKDAVQRNHGSEKFSRSFHPLTQELQQRFPFTIREAEA